MYLIIIYQQIKCQPTLIGYNFLMLNPLHMNFIPFEFDRSDLITTVKVIDV